MIASRNKGPKDPGREPGRRGESCHFPKEHAFSEKTNQDSFILRNITKLT